MREDTWGSIRTWQINHESEHQEWIDYDMKMKHEKNEALEFELVSPIWVSFIKFVCWLLLQSIDAIGMTSTVWERADDIILKLLMVYWWIAELIEWCVYEKTSENVSEILGHYVVP